ncbi:MAG TPA: acyl-CoA desaturase, partial [Acidimicrobiia bacterium]|nr:acyl-CoA desaturase [Acidimicrobiia bacterium]
MTITPVDLDARVDAPSADVAPDADAVTTKNSKKRRDDQVNLVSSTAFFALHLTPLLAFWTGITATAVALFFVTFFGRMWAITAGYHRYFSHRSFRMNRFWGAVLAFAGTTAAQKGPLWWAAHHRNHHRYSDTEKDIHSPKKGFWWSHVVWILCDKYNKSDQNLIRDFSKYPEMRFIDKYDWIGPWALGITCFLVGGWSGLVVGFFASTVLLWHSTFTINSLAHVWGRRVYETEDTSRNNPYLAVLTGGEGWHNNHHRYPFSARQGFRWWQIDTT